MAEITTFPILHTSLHASLKPEARKKSNARSHRPGFRDTPRVSESKGIDKKKQSKSRNGCVTCKAKRLKCDEIKPTCEQCKKRNVACEGYKKDFKWRPFEEPNCTRKRTTKASKDSRSSTALSMRPCSRYTDNLHDRCQDYTETIPHAHYTPPYSAISSMYDQLLATSTSYAPLATANSMCAMPTLSPYIITPQSISPIDVYTPFFLESRSLCGDDFITGERSEITAPSSVTSPQLLDLPLYGADYFAPPDKHSSHRNQHEAIYQPNSYVPSDELERKNVKEVPRNLDYNLGPWPLQHSSPTAGSKASFPIGSQNHHLLAQPQQAVTSSEAISRSFHYDQCGVPYVKDRPTENPWRTLVWPLARDCSALYHAIASMTCFHQSSQFLPMRTQGIDHMRTAIEALEEGLPCMRSDAAIATKLVLALGGLWDMHIDTGINHIKGARVLITQALMEHRRVPKQGEEWTRLKFLCNTWIYMDVVARLISADDDGESDDVDAIYDSIHSTDHTETSLDPLMGCAHSLFPIIGRVATLIRKLQRMNLCSPDLIAQTMDIKSQLEEWTPLPCVKKSEDETTSQRDSIRTATAYQYATLLYLHQAIPSIPSPSALTLAKRALGELAAIEPSSRSCIIHVYPLLVAGCEMIKKEDRAWVVQRWELFLSRVKLGIIAKTLAVTKELWARRDAYAEQCSISKASRNYAISPTRPLKGTFDLCSGHKVEDDNEDVCWLGSRPKSRAAGSLLQSSMPVAHLFEQQTQEDDLIFRKYTEVLDPEYTVKGRLHWLGVMQDWN